MSNFMKIRPAVAELFHADGRTDSQTDRQTYMKKLTVAFRNFCEAPKNPSAATTVHLRDYLAEILRAIQKRDTHTHIHTYVCMCVYIHIYSDTSANE